MKRISSDERPAYRQWFPSHAGSIALSFLLLITCSAIASLSKNELRRDSSSYKQGNQHPPIYLPAPKYVQLITFGFDHFASDLLWFNTINYFGTHYQGDKDYRWLYHMCDLVTELDRNKHFAFEFCGTLLSWEAKNPQLSNIILTKAISHHPQMWRYRFLRGFNYWYFLEDKTLALADLQTGAQMSDAPPFVASLASRLLSDNRSIDTAILFLKDLLANTSEPNAQKSLRARLRRAYLTKRMEYLQQALDTFQQRYGQKATDLNQLVTSGLIKRIPREPFGGEFFLDAATYTVATSSKRKGLTFNASTARTGLAKKEFEH